ncbi:MAG: hypothetical protein ACLURG_03250 [Gemmiger sp.]
MNGQTVPLQAGAVSAHLPAYDLIVVLMVVGRFVAHLLFGSAVTVYDLQERMSTTTAACPSSITSLTRSAT